MAVYQYLAKDGTGRKFSGMYSDIEDVAGLRDELAKINCVLVKAHRKRTETVKHRRIKKSEVVTFAYKFAGMYSAGLPILNCLKTLENQAENPALKYVISDVRQSIQTGSNLRDACAKHGRIFSDFFLGMIEAGESSGKLGTTLEMSASYLEKQEDIRRKIVSAFTYPIVVTIMCLIVIAFLLTFVMPTFTKMYNQAHMSLPGPTQILISLSNFVINFWWAVIIISVTGVMAVRWLLKKPRIRAHWDTFKLNMPVFAGLNRMLAVSHFIRTFSMLVSVGIPLIDALELASSVTHNHKMTSITRELQQMIKSGAPVAKALRSHSIFPGMITELAASGEQVGQLSEMLDKGTELLDKDIDVTISAMLARMEPVLTVIMGVIVGLILIGAYLPMFDYMAQMG